MPVTLEQLVAESRQRAEAARKEISLSEMAARAAQHTPRGFHRALVKASLQGVAIIAEMKQASPSKGTLRGTFHVSGIASSYERAGAAALSVLTEDKYFLGSLAHLREASAATQLPCLRKDFIVDEYQVFEAKANGADAVLLIAAALTDAQLSTLFGCARELQIDALCEVHDEDDLDRVRILGAEIVGVNSRDLRTLEVDMDVHKRLAPLMPEGATRIAESGIRTGSDVRHLRANGYQAFLIGEHFMRDDDPGAALSRLIGEAKAPPLGSAGVGAFTTGTKD